MVPSLISYTQDFKDQCKASAASLLIVKNGEVLTEWYSGHHHHKSGALQVTEDSMFNLYSVRKTYVGLATALAMMEGEVTLDTCLSDVIQELPKSELGDTTFRHLATKTGAKYFGGQRMEREEVANLAIKQMTGMNIAELISKRVLEPMGLKHTEWVTVPKERLVCDFQAADGYASVRIESNEGHERNLYASTRDLLSWGLLHVHKGIWNGVRIIPSEVFEMIDQLRAETSDRHRIFGWYYKDRLFYATGAAGCHCVIIPELQAVGVRMLNRYTSKYKEDQIRFNETLYHLLESGQAVNR